MKNAIKHPLQAKLHCYGASGEKKCLHVVGSNFSEVPCSRPAALEQLAKTYGAMLDEFAASNMLGLRMLPVSAGNFAGDWKHEIPVLTANAVHLAFRRLTTAQ